MQKMDIEINTDTIPLDKFLKWSAVIESGGMAKTMIQEGEIKVNGVTETKRSKILRPGDSVQLGNILMTVRKAE